MLKEEHLFINGKIKNPESEEESIYYRDLYLKGFYENLIQGPLTGKIIIDKPWVQNYSAPCACIVVKTTMYENFKSACKERMDETAIIIHDTDEKYTYRQLLEMIDKTAANLVARGCTDKSSIAALLNNSIEEPIFLLAASKIGCQIRYIDYTKSTGIIKKSVDEIRPDIIVLDEMMMPLEPPLNPKRKLAIVCNTSRKYNRGNYISFNVFVSEENPNIEPAKFDENKNILIINSSGTTGSPKPISLNERNVNSAARKILYTNFQFGNNSLMIKIIPPQIALGLITSLYTSLISGTKVALVRGANPIDSMENASFFIKNYKAIKEDFGLEKITDVLLFASPMYYRTLLSRPDIEDMSFITGMLAAGSKMTKEELTMWHQVLLSRNCSTPICNAYGQNEMTGATSLNDTEYNTNGSAGFPSIGTNMAVINPNTLEILDPYEEGIIIEQSDSCFRSYGYQVERTQKAFVILPDGKKWFNTNDLGYMDENGFLNITGRTTRVVIRNDFKIPLDELESKIKVLPFIKNCGLIIDTSDSSNEKIIGYIELADEYKGSFDDNQVQQAIIQSGAISDFEWPDRIFISESLPLLSSGKIDYTSLFEMFKK